MTKDSPTQGAGSAADPLPSWNDGPAKRSVVSFVERVTNEGSPSFVPSAERIATGEHFEPHLTTGVALREYLDKMLAEPFEPFTFSPAGAAVYQLGQFGTAAKKLHTLALKC